MIAALITLLVVIGLISILVIYWPFFEQRSKSAPQSSLLRELDRLHYEKERLMENLQDLELDLQLHKINQGDYEVLKTKLLEETGHTYNMLKHLEETNPILRAVEKDLERIDRELK